MRLLGFYSMTTHIHMHTFSQDKETLWFKVQTREPKTKQNNALELCFATEMQYTYL